MCGDLSTALVPFGGFRIRGDRKPPTLNQDNNG